MEGRRRDRGGRKNKKRKVKKKLWKECGENKQWEMKYNKKKDFSNGSKWVEYENLMVAFIYGLMGYFYMFYYFYCFFFTQTKCSVVRDMEWVCRIEQKKCLWIQFERTTQMTYNFVVCIYAYKIDFG